MQVQGDHSVDVPLPRGAVRVRGSYRAAKFMWGAWTGVIALNLRPDRLRLDDRDSSKAVLEEGGDG